jgi:amidase
MSVQGLLTRGSSDLELALPVIFKNDPVDPFHAPLPYQLETKPKNFKVAFCRETPGFETHPEIYKGLELAAAALRDAGYEVIEVDPPLLLETAMAGYRALMGEVIELLGPDIRNYGSKEINQIFDDYFKQFEPYTGTDLLKVLAKRAYYAREWSLFLTQYPLLLSPFLPQPFFKPGRDLEGQEGVREVLGAALWSYSINFLGLPAGCFPTHLAQLARGPQTISVQLIGQRWREDLIVDAMKTIQNRLGSFSNELWSLMEKK